MSQLLHNIAFAIHSQVIERGLCDEKFKHFEDHDLEMDGEVYLTEFFITTNEGDQSEPNQYDIVIISVGIYLCDEIKLLYPEVDVFKPSNN